MPMWVRSLNKWSHEQGQPLPYNGNHNFYNLDERGGPTDRALPILIRRVAHNVELGVATLQRTMELEADSDANINRIFNLEVAHGRTMRDNEALQQELATTRAEVIELRACLLYTSPSPRDVEESRMPPSA